MQRKVVFELPFDACMFTPLQMQPRTLFALMMGGWAHWVRAHLVSFPRLILEHHVSAVAMGARLEYLEPMTFLDAEALEVTVRLGTRRGGSMMLLEYEHRAAGVLFARAHLLLRTVRLEDVASLAAVPGVLPPALLAKHDADEIGGDAPARVVPGLVAEMEVGSALAEGGMPLTFHRYLCEVADQWSFAEVPGLTGASREQMVLALGANNPLLRQGLVRPVRRIDVEYTRPFFSFDPGDMQSRAWERGGKLAFVHRLVSKAGVHATLVEQF